MRECVPRSASILSRDEQTVFDLHHRALLHYVTGRLTESAALRAQTIRKARRFLTKAPTARMWILLGDAYVQWWRRAACYRQALRTEPCNAEAAYELARIEFERGDRPLVARRLIEAVLKNPPEDLQAEAFDLAADVFEATGNPRKAEAARRKASFWRRRRWWAREGRSTVSTWSGARSTAVKKRNGK